MERIDLLLEKLDNTIPQSLAKKIDKLDQLDDKLELAEQDFNSDPSDENKESLQEIKDYIEEFEEEICEQLETLYNNKKNNDGKVVVEEKKPIVEAPKNNANTEPENKDKKESSGVLGLVIGGILLVGSLGAINYFKNNK